MFIHFRAQIINIVKQCTVNKIMDLLTSVDYKSAVKEGHPKLNNWV